MNEEVSKTLIDLERKLQQLEGELSSIAPAQAIAERADPFFPAGAPSTAGPPPSEPETFGSDHPSYDRSGASLPDADRGETVIVWDEHGPAADDDHPPIAPEALTGDGTISPYAQAATEAPSHEGQGDSEPAGAAPASTGWTNRARIQDEESSDTAIVWDGPGPSATSVHDPVSHAAAGIIGDPSDRLDPASFDPHAAGPQAPVEPPSFERPTSFDPPTPFEPPAPPASFDRPGPVEPPVEDLPRPFEPKSFESGPFEPKPLQSETFEPRASEPEAEFAFELPEPSDEAFASVAELTRSRERVHQITRELADGFDELLRLRERLEQAKGELIHDYKRLLASRDSAAASPPPQHD